VVLETSKLTED